jgi:hypothetical protein
MTARRAQRFNKLDIAAVEDIRSAAVQRKRLEAYIKTNLSHAALCAKYSISESSLKLAANRRSYAGVE